MCLEFDVDTSSVKHKGWKKEYIELLHHYVNSCPCKLRVWFKSEKYLRVAHEPSSPWAQGTIGKTAKICMNALWSSFFYIVDRKVWMWMVDKKSGDLLFSHKYFDWEYLLFSHKYFDLKYRLIWLLFLTRIIM